jgi:hypothetical protein
MRERSVFASNSCARNSRRRITYAWGAKPTELRNERAKYDSENPKWDVSAATLSSFSRWTSIYSSMLLSMRSGSAPRCSCSAAMFPVSSAFRRGRIA